MAQTEWADSVTVRYFERPQTVKSNELLRKVEKTKKSTCIFPGSSIE